MPGLDHLRLVKGDEAQFLIMSAFIVIVTFGSICSVILAIKKPYIKTFNEAGVSKALVADRLIDYLAGVTCRYTLNTSYSDVQIPDDPVLKAELYSLRLSSYRTSVSLLSSATRTDWMGGARSSSTVEARYFLRSDYVRAKVVSSVNMTVYKVREGTTMLPSEKVPRYVNYEVVLRVIGNGGPAIDANVAAFASLNRDVWHKTDAVVEKRLDGSYIVRFTLVYGEEYGKLVVSWEGIRCEMPVEW